MAHFPGMIGMKPEQEVGDIIPNLLFICHD